jgi:hypothetical protein
MLEYYNRQDYFWRTYGRGDYAEGWRLRGFDIAEYPRWPVKPMSKDDRKRYENNINQFFKDASEVIGHDVRVSDH